MKRKVLNWLLTGAAVISIVTIPLAHEDGWVRDLLCQSTSICMWSDHAAFWNKVCYDLAIGTVVSLLFYWLLVRLPERSRQTRLRTSLLLQYDAFRQECIIQLLFASGLRSVNIPLVDELSVPKAFREYFYPDQKRPRWYAAMNDVDCGTGETFRAIVKAFERFKSELDFTISQADIDDDDVFSDLKGLSQQLQFGIDTRLGTDEVKSLFGILQQLFGGWKPLVGSVDDDRVETLLKRI